MRYWVPSNSQYSTTRKIHQELFQQEQIVLDTLEQPPTVGDAGSCDRLSRQKRLRYLGAVHRHLLPAAALTLAHAGAS